MQSAVVSNGLGGNRVTAVAIDPIGGGACTGLIGTDRGMYRLICGSNSPAKSDLYVDALPVTSITVLTPPLPVFSSLIGVSGGEKLLILNTTSGKWRHEWMQCMFDDYITALSFDQSDGNLWIGNNQSLGLQTPNTEFDRFGPLEGLTAGNITVLATSSTDGRQSKGLWIGTINSLSWLPHPTTPQPVPSPYNRFRYFRGPAYLPNDQILSIAISSATDSVFVVSVGGLSVFRWTVWTLQDKAAYLNRVMPRHDLWGYGLAGGSSLLEWGNVSTAQETSDDNNGLWTGVYVSSQALRYAVTGEEEARELAWKYWIGMETLNNITNIDGLISRSLWPVNDNPQQRFGGHWVNSTTIPSLAFKRDASSDEAVGHMVAYTLMYQLVAQTPEEKARVARVYLVSSTFVQPYMHALHTHRRIHCTGCRDDSVKDMATVGYPVTTQY